MFSRDIKPKLSSAGDKSISHITCTAFLAYFLIPQATRADYLWVHDIALTFPALTLQSCVIWYTLVTIIRLDTGASGMYRIPASGGRHLGNMVLPPPTSLSQSPSPFSLSPSFHSAKFHERPTRFTSPHRPSDMCSHFRRTSHNRRTCEGQFRVSGLFYDPLLTPFFVKRYTLQWTSPFA